MNDANEINEWVEYAEEDFTMAKSAIRRNKPLTISSCFHSQQCAEKYLKAVLVANEVEFPKTHDLLILNVLCNQAGILTGRILGGYPATLSILVTLGINPPLKTRKML